jgi:hypothetical protein
MVPMAPSNMRTWFFKASSKFIVFSIQARADIADEGILTFGFNDLRVRSVWVGILFSCHVIYYIKYAGGMHLRTHKKYHETGEDSP